MKYSIAFRTALIVAVILAITTIATVVLSVLGVFSDSVVVSVLARTVPLLFLVGGAIVLLLLLERLRQPASFNRRFHIWVGTICIAGIAILFLDYVFGWSLRLISSKPGYILPTTFFAIAVAISGGIIGFYAAKKESKK